MYQMIPITGNELFGIGKKLLTTALLISDVESDLSD